MKTINPKGNIKKQFADEGLCYPHKKSNGKYGLKGSTLLDKETLKDSEQAVIEYLKNRNIIILEENKNERVRKNNRGK